MVVLEVLAWVVVALLAVAAATATFGVSSRVGLAVAHDGLPYLLVLAWPILLLALLDRNWALAAAAGVLVAYHLVLVLPRLLRTRPPRWVASAPRVELTVANVFVDNPQPQSMAAQLIATDSDVIVVAEWNPAFAAAFDAAGGRDRYPHRICNDCDDPGYIVTVVSKAPFDDSSEVTTLGSLIVIRAVVSCAARELSLIAVHPTAVVDPGGYEQWKAQIDELIAYLPTLSAPFVVAGDFNGTRFRPEFQRLLALGLIDVHDTLGRGLSSSFRLGTRGALAAAGTVVRLDHALLSRGVWPVAATDLESCGSDHVPFTVTLAVRPNTKVDAITDPGRDACSTVPGTSPG